MGFANFTAYQPKPTNDVGKKRHIHKNSGAKMDLPAGGPLLKGIPRTRGEETLGSDTATVTHHKFFT